MATLVRGQAKIDWKIGYRSQHSLSGDLSLVFVCFGVAVALFWVLGKRPWGGNTIAHNEGYVGYIACTVPVQRWWKSCTAKGRGVRTEILALSLPCIAQQ